jgi:dipeptidyl aminopeptidase/acylaminoacyl peptidase
VQLYRALSDLGREVEFWAYPREDHGFVEPAHRVHYVKRWADWYDEHSGATPPAATPAP